MEKILIALKICLTRKVNDPTGMPYVYTKANPYNPLTYVLLLLTIPIGIILYGVNEAREDVINLFKWR